MKAIYEFFWDCGRMGELSGLFIAETSEVEKLIGRNINFGEVLGKHSEIYGTVTKDDFTIKSTDQEFIAKFEEIMGKGTISGYNPLDYLDNDLSDEEDNSTF